MKLDLGCGDRPYEDGTGWTHFDERDLPDVEIVGKIEDVHMYVDPKSCEAIMARHILEHFSHRHTNSILVQWWRLLKDGGVLHVEVPNLGWQARTLADGHEDWGQEKLVTLIFGDQDYPGNFHKTGFTYLILKRDLERAGFNNVHVQDIGMVLVAEGTK